MLPEQEIGPLRILVCGSRRYDNDARIEEVLRQYAPVHAGPRVALIHGNAAGADTRAGEIGYWLGFDVQPYQADWAKHGKAAGPIRNRQMLDTNPDLVIAFAGGVGTKDCVNEAKRRGIPVRSED